MSALKQQPRTPCPWSSRAPNRQSHLLTGLGTAACEQGRRGPLQHLDAGRERAAITGDGIESSTIAAACETETIVPEEAQLAVPLPHMRMVRSLHLSVPLLPHDCRCSYRRSVSRHLVVCRSNGLQGGRVRGCALERLQAVASAIFGARVLFAVPMNGALQGTPVGIKARRCRGDRRLAGT